MKEIYFILFILSLLSNLSESIEESSENNRVSKLIGMVRMETIDKSLLFLPKRNEVNILQMVNYMIKAKEEYSFNEAESAFLVFKWIGQNIRINFNDEDLDNPINAYTSGEGTPKALSSLFNNICTFFKVNSGSISGYLKWINYKDDVIVNDREYTWNYVEINGEYYLIDVSQAAELNFYPQYMYLHFGTKPEIFIRLHFPKDSKWQLLSEPYTFEKFESMALLSPFFYLIGFKAISPDTQTYESGKFILTSDILIERQNIGYGCITQYGESINDEDDDYPGSLINEIEFDLNEEKCLIYYLVARPENSKTYFKIAYFSPNNSNKSFLNFKSMPISNSNVEYNNYSNSKELEKGKILKSKNNRNIRG